MNISLPGGRVFQLQPVLMIVTAAAMAILITLGNWQLQRREWKLALIEKIEIRLGAAPISFDAALARARSGEELDYMPVRIDGVFAHQFEARVFGSYEGAAGVYVFTPLKRDGGVVYINRGFAPQAAAAQECFCMPAGDAVVAITGLFRSAEHPSPPAAWFQPPGQSADGLWFVRDPAKFAAQAKLDAPAYYIDAGAGDGAQWPRGGTTRIEFRNNHLDYALTWYGLALTLFGIWLILSLKKQ